jgi:hypothetical protein
MYDFITLGYSYLAHHIIICLYYIIFIFLTKFTYLFIPWSRVLLEKLTGFQLEIPRILWNPKVHYRIHKCLPHFPLLSQLDSTHIPTFHSLKIHPNIILSSMPGSLKWSFSFRFPHQNPAYASPLPQTRYMPHPSYASLFYHANSIEWGVQIIKPFFV